MNRIKDNKIILLGIALGAIAGYAYYHYVGCSGGSCAITSKPLNSTVYGALMGGLFGGLFKTEKKQTDKK